MLLDIIIPQYKETEDIIKTLLDSINNQKDVDFNLINVTIVNDYSDVLLSKSFLNKYKKLNIKYLINDKNTGPGLARQKGYDNTSNKYITYIDADDELYDDLVLSKLISFIKKFQPDYLVTNIAVEGFINDKKSLIIKKNNETFPWMHGKVYKRRFIDDNKIRFSEHVRHVEDIFYTTCVVSSINVNEILYLDLITYKWKNNQLSLTRIKDEIPYEVRIFSDVFDAPKYIYEFLCKRNSKQKFSYLIQSIFAIYILLNSPFFKDYSELKEKYNERLIKEYIKPKRNLFIIYKYEDLKNLFNNELKELSIRHQLDLSDICLDDFINEFLKWNSYFCHYL